MTKVIVGMASVRARPATTKGKRRLFGSRLALVAAVAIAVGMTGAGGASAAPSDADRPTTERDASVAQLLAEVLPPPVGDPFFDLTPPNLADLEPGTLLDMRDITPVAAPLFDVPSRVTLLKFRSTGTAVDLSDPAAVPEATFATASLTVPDAPWFGSGKRPVYVNNLAINSLGRGCSPSYLITGSGTAPEPPDKDLPPITSTALAHGFAVLTTDHEGPNMNYGEPFVAGHAILDAIRAVRAQFPDQFEGSRFAMSGYSGGAIATHGAVKLIDSYAPELAPDIVGAAIGGIPLDYAQLLTTMNGNLASGLLASASLGVGRAHPELLMLMSDDGRRLATSPVKRLCSTVLTVGGLGALPLETFLAPQALDEPEVTELFTRLRMPDIPAGTSLLIYNGGRDPWIPASGARELATEQCSLGVPVEYFEGPAEHLVSESLHFQRVFSWLAERLTADDPAPTASSCGVDGTVEVTRLSAS